VIAGTVFDPFHNELFTAARGGGSLLNGSPIHVSAIDDLGISLLATGFPYDKAISSENNLKQFTAMVPMIQGVRRMGSAAMDLCFTACGRIDGYWEPKLKPWDMAAGALIVREAGGTVTAFEGRPFDPERPEIIASNGKIHQRMQELLAGA
jgi:myo-inositol-1(or 4)-monophosphatase